MTEKIIVYGGLILIGILLGIGLYILISPNATIYPQPNFIQNISHGDNYTFKAEDFVVGFKIECIHKFKNEDLLKVNICEECWEGINCYQKTFETTYRTLNQIIEKYNVSISSRSEELCNQNISIGFFYINYLDIFDYSIKNELYSFEESYAILFNEKCDQELKIWRKNESSTNSNQT